MPYKAVSVELISVDKLEVKKTREPSGWGEKAKATVVEGEISEIVIRRDDTSLLGIHIHQDGSITLTNYEGHYCHETLDRNFKLTNTRPWK